MSEYLTPLQLSDLTGYKPNQRAATIRWLKRNGWRYVVDAHGHPKVLTAHRDMKMGAAGEPPREAGTGAEPNRGAMRKLVQERQAAKEARRNKVE